MGPSRRVRGDGASARLNSAPLRRRCRRGASTDLAVRTRTNHVSHHCEGRRLPNRGIRVSECTGFSPVPTCGCCRFPRQAGSGSTLVLSGACCWPCGLPRWAVGPRWRINTNGCSNLEALDTWLSWHWLGQLVEALQRSFALSAACRFFYT